VSDPASSARRFVCRACGHRHATWAARCSSCRALEGLTVELIEVPVLLPALPPQTQSVPQVVAPEPSRPRLMIARAPEPALEDPAEELVDVASPASVPLSDVSETTFARDLTGLTPLDYVLGGGLVVASVILLASPRGIGKCLGGGTPVLMFDGRSLPVEQILPGDRLMGPDGKSRTVLATTAGIGELFRIDPIKGEPWICNGAHVLTLVNGHTDEVIDVPLSEWLAKTPHSDLRRYGKLFSTGINTFGDSTANEQHLLPIDPYFLGVWFGDGTKWRIERTTGEQLAKIQITKPDPEILALCEEQGRLWGLRVHTYESATKRASYQLVANEAPEGEGRWAPNPLLRALRDIVGPEVKVPDAYLRAPRGPRLQFLAGWCDTDGELAGTTFVISQKREDWARTIWWLARSLGFCATIKTRTSHYTRPDGSRFEGTYWVVFISGDTDQIPTRLPRKKAPPRRQKKVATRTGFTVHSLGEGAYYGFSLDSDGRFLLGDFTVTHNSSLALQMLNGLGHRCLYVSGEETLEQVAMTARRIGAASKKVNMLPERNLSMIFAEARAIRAQTIVIDSIQKMRCDDVGGRAGSPGQLKECTAQLVDYAKNNRTALWLIGHTTSDGDIAGPMTIEHEVDVVLELTQGAKFDGNERILTCLGKNRFGPSNLVGHFELTAKGFVSVDADGWNEEL